MKISRSLAASTLVLASLASSAGGEEVEWVTTEDGVRLWAVERGAGAPAILVPNAIYLEEPFGWLANGHRVVFYDLRNRGRSQTVLDEELLAGGIHDDVSDLEAVRRHFGLERPVLLGHSYLGFMVALHAVEHPGVALGMIQVGPVGPVPAETFAAQAEPGDERGAELGRQLGAWLEEAATSPVSPDLCRQYWSIMGKILVGDEKVADQVYRPVLCELPNEDPRHVQEHFVRSILPSLLARPVSVAEASGVEAPVLVLHGTADRAAPHAGGEAWARLLPAASLVTIVGAGHYPWLEAEEQVRSAIRTFLEGLGAGHARAKHRGGSKNRP